MRPRLVSTLAFTVMTVLASEAAGQGIMRAANLEDRLFRYWEIAINGHDMGGGIINGRGAAGSTTPHPTANLVAGKHYIFTLFCDANCTSVELRAVDGANAAIATDAQTPLKTAAGAGEAEAEIGFTAARNGSVRLEVKINACSTAPCAYQIGTFASR